MARFGGKANMRGTQGPHKTIKTRKKIIPPPNPNPRPEMKGKAGRPKFVIDYDIVARLSKIQCTISEIAAILGCHPETLSRDPKFVETYNNSKEGGKMSLRRKQHQVAIKQGNVAMLIFLGKQYLGQKEKGELGGPDDGPIPVQHMMASVSKLSRKEQDDLITLLEKAEVHGRNPYDVSKGGQGIEN